MRTATVIRQVPYQGAGSLEGPLSAAGYDLSYLDAPVADLALVDPRGADLLIVLGGPFGVNGGCDRSFIAEEVEMLRTRLSAGLPTLGICLGAQMIARALGAAVRPMGIQEIGWKRLTLSGRGRTGPLARLGDVPVLHWHGDAFDLPPGAERFAGTDLCRNQAFSIGPRILALQFHLEVDPRGGLQRWIDGHASDLRRHSIDVGGLVGDTEAAARSDRTAVTSMFAAWLDGLQAAR